MLATTHAQAPADTAAADLQPAPVPAPQQAAPGPEAPAPAPDGQTGETVKVLQALILEVKGKAKWRATPEESWQAAKVDDVLSPGAQILTGARSTVAMRVGKNATILVASVSSVSLPEIVQDGAVLRTRAGISYGRADFKVDQAGFANDFEVITPSSVISVRGTVYSVGWGAFDGASITSAASNRIRDIEVSYFNTRKSYALGGKSQSGEKKPDPAEAALSNTVGGPAGSQNAGGSEAQQAADLGFVPDAFANGAQELQQSPGPDGWFSAFASETEVNAFLASLIPDSPPPASTGPIVSLVPRPPPPPPPPPPPQGHFQQAKPFPGNPLGSAQLSSR